LNKRRLGRAGLQATEFGLGTVGIGQKFTTMTDREAEEIVEAAWEGGVRLFDTAPWYGLGLAEHRLGAALYRKPRDEYVVSTKVGRRLEAGLAGSEDRAGAWIETLPNHVVWDFTYDGIMRSFEDSLQRMRLDRIDILLIHDLDWKNHPPEDRLKARMADLLTSGYRALDRLRREKVVSGIGTGINFAPDISRMLDLFDLDVMLVAAPYTLLHQDVLPDLARAHERGVTLMIGAVFQSGLLATGYQPGAKYNYTDDVPEPVLARLRGIEEVCTRHKVSLPSAALHFALAHPAVSAVIPGALRASEVTANLASYRAEIPTAFWQELKERGLIVPEAPVPG
jgi:D-threo-aldose 1-dehydrogenase